MKHINIHTVITVDGVTVSDKKRFMDETDLGSVGYRAKRLHFETLRDLAWALSNKDEEAYYKMGSELGVLR